MCFVAVSTALSPSPLLLLLLLQAGKAPCTRSRAASQMTYCCPHTQLLAGLLGVVLQQSLLLLLLLHQTQSIAAPTSWPKVGPCLSSHMP
jgi:hypothetical protein